MSIKLSDIKDPSLRQTIERMLASETRPAKRVVLSKALCDCESLSGHAHRTDCPLVAEQNRQSKLRQERTRPLLNKLEQRVKARVELEHPGAAMHAQALRFRLANGAWYKPDLAAWVSLAQTTGGHGFRLHCWEAKELRGKGAAKGVLAVKVAAAQFPEVAFWLVTADGGGLRFERVLP